MKNEAVETAGPSERCVVSLFFFLSTLARNGQQPVFFTYGRLVAAKMIHRGRLVFSLNDSTAADGIRDIV